MTLTQAEMEARYDAERAGALYVKPEDTGPWEGIIDILTNDDDDGSADVCDVCGSADPCEHDIEEDARERVPVPPVPAGYPTDRALIYQDIGGVFLCIDRRDGEMVICEKDKPATDDNSFILPPNFVLALAQFLSQSDMRELVAYLRGAASVTAPLGRAA